MREYRTLRALRQTGEVELDGILFKRVVDIDGHEVPIKPGDLYIAQRNGGPRVLTAHRVDAEDLGCIFPVENAYPYDLDECVPVRVLREASEADRHALVGPSDKELRAIFAQPLIDTLEDRKRRSVKFRDWGEHRTYDLVLTDGIQFEDGTWLLEGYDMGRMRVDGYSPAERKGQITFI